MGQTPARRAAYVQSRNSSHFKTLYFNHTN